MNRSIKNVLKFVAIMLSTQSMLQADDEQTKSKISDIGVAAGCGLLAIPLAEAAERAIFWSGRSGTRQSRVCLMVGAFTVLMYPRAAHTVNNMQQERPGTKYYIEPTFDFYKNMANVVAGSMLGDMGSALVEIRRGVPGASAGLVVGALAGTWLLYQSHIRNSSDKDSK